jgi:hypothetical protein
MSKAGHTSIARQVVRLGVATAMSIAGLIAYVALLRALPHLQVLSLYAIPFSIAVGLLPLLYWYRRDAYPMGLVFCAVMFVILRLLGEQLRRFFWPAS